YFCFFFFQAEDGIRDRNVTGVQTCALPIFLKLEQQVGGHVLAQIQRAVRRDDVVDDVLGDLRAVGEILLKAVLEAAHQRFSLVEIGRASCRERVESGGGAV